MTVLTPSDQRCVLGVVAGVLGEFKKAAYPGTQHFRCTVMSVATDLQLSQFVAVSRVCSASLQLHNFCS